MKLGFITAILGQRIYEEMMDFASEQGFECVEVACWPTGKSKEDMRGLSHVDAERVNHGGCICRAYRGISAKKIRSGSALAYYPNVMHVDKERKRKLLWNT